MRLPVRQCAADCAVTTTPSAPWDPRRQDRPLSDTTSASPRLGEPHDRLRQQRALRQSIQHVRTAPAPWKRVIIEQAKGMTAARLGIS